MVDDHSGCGRGDNETGPDDPDCGCRATEREAVCASEGCGYCRAAQARKSAAKTGGPS